MRAKKLRSVSGWPGTMSRLYDASQAWLIVTCIGLAAGIMAAFIDVTSKWLGDLRFGYCSAGWYLEKKFCCWEVEGMCSYWISWDQALGTSQPALGYIINYVFYLAFAVLSRL
jgi:chloride channel 3/4/5